MIELDAPRYCDLVPGDLVFKEHVVLVLVSRTVVQVDHRDDRYNVHDFVWLCVPFGIITALRYGGAFAKECKVFRP